MSVNKSNKLRREVKYVIDIDGNVLNHISYDSFGRVVNKTNPDVDFRFGYTGRELNEETGLYYYRARYYDPDTGRFIGEDPIKFNGGDTNLYRYVGNSPLSAVDPFGLESANLTKLLNLACPGSSGGTNARTCDNYPLAKHYS